MINPKLMERILKLSQNVQLSMYDIAKKVGVSHETVRNYLKRAEVYDEWKQKRQEYVASIKEERRLWAKKYKQRELKKLLNSLIQLSFIRAGKDKALKAALIIYYRPNIPRKSFDSYYNLFKSYFQAKEQSEKKSLKMLGEQFGFSLFQVSRYLKTLKLEPFKISKPKRKLSEYEKKKVIAACLAKTKLPLTDRSRLLGFEEYICSHYAERLGVKSKGKQGIIGGTRIYSYTTALEILQGLDLGFSIEQVSYLLDVPAQDVKLITSKRKSIEEIVEDFLDFVKIIDIVDALELGYLTCEVVYLADITMERYLSLIKRVDELYERFGKASRRASHYFKN